MKNSIQIQTHIPNEFSPSLINYHVEHPNRELNFYDQRLLNPAELQAQHEEQIRFEEEAMKQEILKIKHDKYWNDIKQTKNKKIKDEKAELREQEKQQKWIRAQKLKEYDTKIRGQMKATLKQVNSNKLEKCVPASKSSYNSNHKIRGISKEKLGEIWDSFSFKNTQENNNDSDTSKNNEETSLNNASSRVKDISQKIHSQINDMKSNHKCNPGTVNAQFEDEDNIRINPPVPENIEYTYYQKPETWDKPIQDKINENVQLVKNFRKTGLIAMMTPEEHQPSPMDLPMNNISDINMSSNQNNNTSNIITNSSQCSFFTKNMNRWNKINTQLNNTNKGNSFKPGDELPQTQNELQQRRYQKALKKWMIDQWKNKSINIPSICSCGQLQRKIESLVNGVKLISVNDLMNVDCANNCIYYQKPSDYHRAWSNIIQSIRSDKLDSK